MTGNDTLATTTSDGRNREADDSLPARTAKTWQLAAIIVAMFVLPWLVWASAIAKGNGLISWRLPQGIGLWVLAPSIVAVTALIGGVTALRDLGSRIIRWRVPVRVYLLAVATPVVIAGIVVAIAAVTGRASQLGVTMTLPAALIYLLCGTGLFLLTEEAGWRGLLMPRLQSRWAPLTASLVLGLVWGVWHFPLVNVPDAADSGLPFVGMFLLIVATSVLVTGLVNAAGGSVIIAAIFHAAFDASYSWTGVVGPDHALLWIAAIVTSVAAVGLAIATRGRLFLAR